MCALKKKYLTAAALLLSLVPLFADRYRIRGVAYGIDGNTKPYALDTKVPLDRKTVFEDGDDLSLYLDDYRKRLENTRAFESVQVDYTLTQEAETEATEDAEDRLYLVDIQVSARDSLHLLGMPYPKYDSNSGFTFKLKMKDTNFLGFLETMNFDLNFELESKNEASPNYVFGLNMDFNIPFKMGMLDALWVNEHKVSYTIGEKTPEWNLKTGLALSLPFDRWTVKLDLNQHSVRDLDYEDADVNGTKVHYGDGTYFVEDAKLSVPITIQEVSGWGNIYYTPYLQGRFNWDADGISDLNDDLKGPVISLGQTISTSRVDWVGNFRNGLSVSFTQSFSYNIQRLAFIPAIQGELKAYRAFDRLALASDIYAFACLNGTEAFGSRLRGIRDEQYYSIESGHGNQKALETPAAVVMNFDMPVRIFVARWDELPLFQKSSRIRKIARYLSFEFQISPFVDIGLSRNRATGLDFHYRDGFYAAGIEALVFPLKWKGMTVRGSIGLDLGQKLPGLKGKLNQEWRNAKAYEISVGIGLQY